MAGRAEVGVVGFVAHLGQTSSRVVGLPRNRRAIAIPENSGLFRRRAADSINIVSRAFFGVSEKKKTKRIDRYLPRHARNVSPPFRFVQVDLVSILTG